jgi:hypothetical protein
MTPEDALLERAVKEAARVILESDPPSITRGVVRANTQKPISRQQLVRRLRLLKTGDGFTPAEIKRLAVVLAPKGKGKGTGKLPTGSGLLTSVVRCFCGKAMVYQKQPPMYVCGARLTTGCTMRMPRNNLDLCVCIALSEKMLPVDFKLDDATLPDWQRRARDVFQAVTVYADKVEFRLLDGRAYIIPRDATSRFGTGRWLKPENFPHLLLSRPDSRLATHG